MGKHDKVTADSFTEARIQELENRLAFAEESCRQLRETVARCNKWVKEVETAAFEKVSALEEENAKLKETIVRLAVN